MKIIDTFTQRTFTEEEGSVRLTSLSRFVKIKKKYFYCAKQLILTN